MPGSVGSVIFSSLSKSIGNGISSPKSGAVGVLSVFGYMFGFVLHTVHIGVFMRFGCARARINTPRISAGILSGSGGVIGVGVAGTSGSLSVSVFADFGNSFANIPAMNFGTGKANSGFCVLITIVVVATYNGIAANTKMPNVNPASPRKCACDARIQ